MALVCLLWLTSVCVSCFNRLSCIVWPAATHAFKHTHNHMHTQPSANCCLLPCPEVFLSVFKWEARKGWKDLVQAFCDAFKPTDPVVLWILAKPFMESGDVSLCASAALSCLTLLNCIQQEQQVGGDATPTDATSACVNASNILRSRDNKCHRR